MCGCGWTEQRAWGAGSWGSAQWVRAAACRSSCPGLPPAGPEGRGDSLSLRLGVLTRERREPLRPEGFRAQPVKKARGVPSRPAVHRGSRSGCAFRTASVTSGLSVGVPKRQSAVWLSLGGLQIRSLRGVPLGPENALSPQVLARAATPATTPASAGPGSMIRLRKAWGRRQREGPRPEPSPGRVAQPLWAPGLFPRVRCHLPRPGSTRRLPGTFTAVASHLRQPTSPLSQLHSWALTHRCREHPAGALRPPELSGLPRAAGVARLGIRRVLGARSTQSLSPRGTFCAAHGAGVVTASPSGADAGLGRWSRSQGPAHHGDPTHHPQPPHRGHRTLRGEQRPLGASLPFSLIICGGLFLEQLQAGRGVGHEVPSSMRRPASYLCYG